MKETTRSISIIPVGDDEVLGGSMADFHLGSKYFMAKATTELDAVTYFREIKPHLVIAKQRNPVIDGPEFHEITAKEGGLTPRIIASGEGNVQHTADLHAQNQRDDKEVAERQVQEYLVLTARNEWERTVNALPDIIVIVDRKQRITFVNQSMQERLEKPLAEMIGQVCPMCKNEFSCLHQKLMVDRKSRTVEMYNRDFDAHYSINIIPNYSADGDMVGSVCVLHDITELNKKLQEKEVLQTQLLHAHKLESVTQLASGIAHEINTPTQFISANVGFINDAFTDFKSIIETLAGAAQENKLSTTLLQDALQQADWPFLETEIPKAIKESQEGLNRVTSLVRAMKQFTHPGSKDAELTDINHIIETTLMVSSKIWEDSSELILDLALDLPSVTCLADEIGQVLLNLLVNAAHSNSEKLSKTPKGKKGQISIRTEADGPSVLIHIADTGCGIPESNRARVFDPFFTTKEVGRGAGQGLAISYDVVTRKHGGSLTFATVLGEGTTFTVRLPVKKANSIE